MSNNILFIFEGQKTEKLISDSLFRYFLNENTVVTCAYCTTIYKIHNEFLEDEYLDTFNLVKDLDANKEILKDFKRTDFAQIFMFFDYDGHASNAGDHKLINLLNFFEEETEKGKLYISYPMVEALKHVEDFNTFHILAVACKNFSVYKNTVNKMCLKELKHFNLYNENIWEKVISAHLYKMNQIVNNTYTFPTTIINQLTIFNKQLENHKTLNKTIAILSSFPVFLHDYYGNQELKHRLNEFPH